jgi:hypothetical protein
MVDQNKDFSVHELLRGDPEATKTLALADADSEMWVGLVDHLIDDPQPSPQLMKALWQVHPNVSQWWRNLEGALSQSNSVPDDEESRSVLFSWLRDSVLAAFADVHDAVIDVRIQELQMSDDDDQKFASARQLHAELLERSAAPERLATVALLVADAAIAARNYSIARDYAIAAINAFCTAKDDPGKSIAEGALIASLLHSRDWSAGLQSLDDALQTRARHRTPQ